MKKLRIIFALMFFLISSLIICQSFDFARTTNYENNMVKLTSELVNPEIDQVSKFKAIILWFTDNIRNGY